MGEGRESQELRKNLYVSWRKGGENTKEREMRDQDSERKRERRKRKERERGRRRGGKKECPRERQKRGRN